jgi:hydrogenase small subunit
MDILNMQVALAKTGGPKVIWLQGSGCSGCSISFLNRISDTVPTTAANVLQDSIDLIYHPTLMAAAGSQAASIIRDAIAAGGYVLLVEGGVPTAFGGAACWPWSIDGKEVTFQEAVIQAAANAAKVVCVGACASFGGVSAAGENPTGVTSVAKAIGKPTVNIPGCPPHPDWIVWAIAQILAGNAIELDAQSRPTALYGTRVHDDCQRLPKYQSKTFASICGVDESCLNLLGCRGPNTGAPCPTMKWNNGANWCVDANANCVGCTESTFPGGDLHVTLF